MAASATQVLQTWCEEFGIGDGPVVAHCIDRLAALGEGESGLAEEWLRASKGEIAYRRVRLMRGGVCLSDAENWFLPARLTPPMIADLGKTDIPFGVVVSALRPTRQTILSRILISPDEERLPGIVLEHRALLRDGEGQPLSFVQEHYRAALVQPDSI